MQFCLFFVFPPLASYGCSIDVTEVTASMFSHSRYSNVASHFTNKEYKSAGLWRICLLHWQSVSFDEYLNFNVDVSTTKQCGRAFSCLQNGCLHWQTMMISTHILLVLLSSLSSWLDSYSDHWGTDHTHTRTHTHTHTQKIRHHSLWASAKHSTGLRQRFIL